MNKIEQAPAGDSGDFSPETKDKKRGFMRTIRNKFMAMALAGFVTLGGGWEKSYSDQIKIAKQESSAPQFILEEGITAEKLEAFEDKLKKEEPEFWEWLENYVDSVRASLREYEHAILSTSGGKEDTEAEKTLMRESEEMAAGLNDSQREEFSSDVDKFIKLDHRAISFFRYNPGVLEEHFNYLRKNLDRIVLGSVFLDDSRDIRRGLARFNEPPEMHFSPHSLKEIFGLRGHHQISYYPPPFVDSRNNNTDQADANRREQNFKHRIIMLPLALTNLRGEIDLNFHGSYFVHELIHSLTISTSVEDFISEKPDDMYWTIIEGITQNKTLEIMQLLSRDEGGLEPIMGMYDERVIYAGLLAGIMETYRDGDLFNKWHARLINDKDIIDHLREAVISLDLDKGIADKMRGMNSDNTYLLLADLLSRLRIDQVKIAPEFIRSILTRGRSIDDQQIQTLGKNMQELLEWFYAGEQSAKEQELTKQLTSRD